MIPFLDLGAINARDREALIQAFTQTGYQPTPGYPGQRSVFDMGFDFLLFD